MEINTVTVWRDTKDVSVLSNVHSLRGGDNVSRKKRDGTVIRVTAPPVVKDYNANMGAIDKSNQMKRSYALDRKSQRWWLRIFFHLLDICRLNAFIPYQQAYLQWNSGPVEEEVKPMLTQKEFTSSIVKSLCGTFTSRKPRGRPSDSSPPLVRLTGDESVNLVKRGAMKKGRCHECSAGPNKKRARLRHTMVVLPVVSTYVMINAMTLITEGLLVMVHKQFR